MNEQDQAIVSFLNSKDLSSFYFLKNVNFDLLPQDEKNILIPKILATISAKLFLDIYEEKINAYDTKVIVQFCERYNEFYNGALMLRVYGDFENYINSIRVSYPTPFKNEFGLTLNNSVKKIINSQVYTCLLTFPMNFNPIRKTFAAWCHNDVVCKSLKRNSNFREYEKSDLVVLRNAMNIAANFFQSESHNKNISLIEPLITSQKKSKNEWLIIFSIISGTLVLFKILKFFKL